MAEMGRPKKDADVDDAFRARILHKYMLGESAEQIAEDLRLDHWTIHLVVRQAAEELRGNMRQQIEEAFLSQTLGLQHLKKRCMEAIERAARLDPPQFDEKAVKALIMVYDREGKLNGMDKGGPASGKDRYAWMQGATEEELRKRARDLGIRLPEPITPTDA